MTFFEAYDNIVLESEQSWFDFINVVMPYHAIEYNLGFENRRIMWNHKVLWDAVKHHVSQPSNIDPKSAYAKIKANTTVDDDQLMKDLLVFIFAATDTTSKALCTIFMYLSRNDRVRHKLKLEIDDVIGHDDITLSGLKDKLSGAENIDKMEYLGYCVWEALRIAPPLPTTVGYKCTSQKDVRLVGDVTIKSGHHIAPCPYALHFNPNQW